MEGNKTIMQIKNVTKKFGGLVAVNDVSLDIEEGKIIGLIGANGAGKTTLFNMITGALVPNSGKIIFKGNEIQGKECHHISRLGIGRTFQIVKPFTNLTVLDNTIVGALQHYPRMENARKKALEVLKIVGLEHRMDVISSGLGLPELKRLELARALATEPELLLLDEVMAGLNPSDSGNLIKLVREIKDSGITIIIIEHVMKAVMTLSDKVYVLNQGKLISEGTPAEVSEDPEVIKSYLGEKRYAKT